MTDSNTAENMYPDSNINDIADLALDTMTLFLRATGEAFAKALVFQDEFLRQLKPGEQWDVIDRLLNELRDFGMQWCEDESMRQLPAEGSA